MADLKKPEPSPFNKDHFRDTLFFLLVLLILSWIFTRIMGYLRGVDPTPVRNIWDFLSAIFGGFWNFWKGVAVVASVGFVGWSVQSFRSFKKLEKLEDAIFGSDVIINPTLVERADEGNKKWEHVLKLINSDNPSDWRLAIIEADIMLDEALRAQQYHGETVGDMLKAVEPSDMLTLDAAWEAHKIRNRIAHAGTDFDLNAREAKRVITLFESVFKEFEII